MDQEMMKFKEELQELVHKGQKLLQMMQGGNFGQRGGYYGMRDNGSQGGGYNQGSGYNQGGNYGQREQSWMHGPQGYQEQNWGGGGQMPNIDPRYFMY